MNNSENVNTEQEEECKKVDPVVYKEFHAKRVQQILYFCFNDERYTKTSDLSGLNFSFHYNNGVISGIVRYVHLFYDIDRTNWFLRIGFFKESQFNRKFIECKPGGILEGGPQWHFVTKHINRQDDAEVGYFEIIERKKTKPG